MSRGPHWSARFSRLVWLTDHALARAEVRDIPVEVLLDVVETGTLLEKERGQCWIWKSVPGREDNMLCAAALIADAVIVKTVMHHFAPEET